MRERTSLGRRSFLRLSGLAGVGAFTGITGATPGRSPGARGDELLVGVSRSDESKRKGPGRAIEKDLPEQARIAHENAALGYAAVEFPGEGTDRARENFRRAMARREDVKYVEENATFETLLVPNDPRFDDQYADQTVNAPTAWDVTLGDADVTVAVVDQGVKYDHPDLDGNVASDPGYDFVDDDGDPYPDDLGEEIHGTHVAGIAAAEVDNGEGVSGIGNSTILAARALSETGSGSTSDIADAIQWAADEGADVVNLSLGGGGYTNTMKNAVSYATDQGALVVAAAGNDSGQPVSYPAAYSECLAVSALDPDEGLASYSNVGPEIELAAPGTNVLSTWTGDDYETISGTSMATPVVAGVAGLTLAAWDLSNEELRTHLKDTAVDIGLADDEQGSGRVDAGNAVTTEPGSGSGGDDGDDGDDGGDDGGSGDSESVSVSDSLSGYWDADCWSYPFQYDAPSRVVVELSGPSNADFDLYVNDGVGSCPSTSDYDYRSWTVDSQERISIDAPDTSTDLRVLVDSYSGGGDYTVTITEFA
ncbi:S8 family serine peptidase [Halomarina ordinaria]|uniref:S8 family serine peptidase n=1 Tax=Halomarina ordinaria TaxID=3033939 RepID=A0ABD5U4P5_9EURY|nr:S8 family serine peptidase [Halomarina sp. PSRA2]